MAPEGHGAQVLPDSDLGSEKVTYHTKSGVPRYFCFLKFLPKRTGVGVPGRPPPPQKKNHLPALKDHLCAKFHRNLSSGLDFYREHTNRHCPICIRRCCYLVIMVVKLQVSFIT